MAKKEIAFVAGIVAAIAAVLTIVYRRHEPVPTGGVEVVRGSDIPRATTVRIETVPAASQGAGTALLAEAPAVVARKHDRIVSARQDQQLAAKAQSAIAARLGIAASLRFMNVAVQCANDACEISGDASGDEVTTRLAMREGSFLDEVAKLGCTTDTDMVAPGTQGATFILYLDCQR